MSWRSWGKIVHVRLALGPQRTVEVTVESRPRFWTTLVDGGKNYENVVGVLSALGDVERASAAAIGPAA